MSARENREMFDLIASWYDGTNRLLSLSMDRYWRRRAVSLLAPGPDEVFLDIGCGTGDVALEILRQQPDCRVVGIDPSQGMLEIGRDKVEASGLGKSIELLEGSALDIQFPDHSFDGVITSFCIRNVTDRRRALFEFHRVLRPAGRVVILELTDPTGPVMAPLFRIYSNLVMPLVTKIMSSVSAYRYLTDSMADFPPAETFREIMEQVGFVSPEYFRMTGGITTVFLAKTDV